MRMSKSLREELELTLASCHADAPYASMSAVERLRKVLGYDVDQDAYPLTPDGARMNDAA